MTIKLLHLSMTSLVGLLMISHLAIQELIQIISEHTSVSIERISPESNFVSDLEMDELTCYELFMGVEEEFSIEIPDENREVILTVNDLYQYLVENL